MISRVIAALTAALVLVYSSAGANSTFTVDTILGEWTDSSRADRVVPYKIYLPREAQGARPIVIFSHGLGGNRDGAVYLLDHLAAHGYAAVAVQHHGSDTPAIFGNVSPSEQFSREKLMERINAITLAVAIERFRDIPFTISALEAMNANDARLRGRLDLSRVGMSGHSFGALTTLIIAGQSGGPGGRINFADHRITAAIAYSPSKPRYGDPSQAFASIRMPTFHLTGTLDEWPTDANVENRKVPYRNIAGADKYLLVFNGGDHMVFSGRDFRGNTRPKDPRFHALVQKASLAYWDAYLLGKAEAKSYLTGGAFARELGADGTFEFQVK